MDVRLNRGKIVCEVKVCAFEARIRTALPADYRRFLTEHDGSEPETNIFRIDATNESGVNAFIPFDRLETERAFIADTVQASMFPIAYAEGGNYACLDMRTGAVCFWDHEDPRRPSWLAGDFAAFLDLLEPFDVSSIQLKPGQVEEVWVDPKLLE